MAYEESSYKVGLKTDKFDGSGFYLWKHKIQMVLVSGDLWDVVSGVETEPNGDDVAALARYRKKEQKARAEISLHLTDSQLPLVTSAVSAKDAWDRLVAQYEQKSLQNILFLKRRCRDLIMTEGDSMLSHINQKKGLAEQLAAIGSPVLEHEQVIELLLSLPSSYQNLIIALEARADSLPMEFLRARLLQEEQKRVEKAKNDPDDKALFSGTKTCLSV